MILIAKRINIIFSFNPPNIYNSKKLIKILVIINIIQE